MPFPQFSRLQVCPSSSCPNNERDPVAARAGCKHCRAWPPLKPFSPGHRRHGPGRASTESTVWLRFGERDWKNLHGQLWPGVTAPLKLRTAAVIGCWASPREWRVGRCLGIATRAAASALRPADRWLVRGITDTQSIRSNTQQYARIATVAQRGSPA